MNIPKKDAASASSFKARRPRVTLHTVAEAAGVSVQTVSNVVNGRIEKVAEETRGRIEREIRVQGYRPNRAARMLRTNRSGLLGYRIRPATDGINGAVLDELLHSLSDHAHAHGYDLLVFSSPDDAAEMEQYKKLLTEHNVDGFILTSTNTGDQRTDWLLDNGVPFVAFGRPWGRTEGTNTRRHDWLDVDGYAGTHTATELLIARGCTRIAFLGWEEGSGAGDDRRAGWDAALTEAQLPDRLNRATEDGVNYGHAAAVELLAEGADAIVCASDSLAIGALVALRAASPELAGNIIGFDNTPVAAAVGLSSVEQPIDTAARMLIDLIVAQIETSSSTGRLEAELLLAPTVRERTPLQGFTPTNIPTSIVGEHVSKE